MNTDEPIKFNPKLVRIPRPRIYVTPEICNRACKKNSRHCMTIEAMQEAMPWIAHPTVDLMTIRWSDPRVGLRYTYLTPKAVQQAILAFDAGMVVKPFNFQLRGGHASTMFTGTSSTGKRRQTHNLGRARILDADQEHQSAGIIDEPETRKAKRKRRSTNWTEVSESIGGRAPRRLSPAHASNQNNRMYGFRGFAPDFIQDFVEYLNQQKNP